MRAARDEVISLLGSRARSADRAAMITSDRARARGARSIWISKFKFTYARLAWVPSHYRNSILPDFEPRFSQLIENGFRPTAIR
eukprot:SAG31_NODE_145_length_22612_cov_5.938169_20_plen_84_part_00